MSVLVEHRGPVTIVTFNRPEASNALDPATMIGLGDALDTAAADDDVKAVILTGAGDRVFCAGLDLRAFAEGGVEISDEVTAGFRRLFRSRYPKPLIAAANGTVVAGGFEVLLRCDLVVAAEHIEFGLPEVQRGLVAGAGVTILPRRIPMPVVLELGLVGSRISAQRALELGLVNRLVPRGEAVAEALVLAEAIAANGPLAVRLTKQLAYAQEDDVSPALWTKIDEVTHTVMNSDDAKEGARAFVEKRPPNWTGR
jgi:enoyl-CoA hydratase/carnithine racemase